MIKTIKPHYFLLLRLLRQSLVAFFMLAGIACAYAQEHVEQARLESVLRQLDFIQSTIEQTPPIDPRARYYFDYQRLSIDLKRIRRGIQEYLSPKRAQPRDPVELIGHYQQEQQDRKMP